MKTQQKNDMTVDIRSRRRRYRLKEGGRGSKRAINGGRIDRICERPEGVPGRDPAYGVRDRRTR